MVFVLDDAFGRPAGLSDFGDRHGLEGRLQLGEMQRCTLIAW